MHFHVIESYRPDTADEIYRRLAVRGRMMPDGVSFVSSWVDMNFERCFMVMEADSEDLLWEWARNWEDLVEFEIVRVQSSEHAQTTKTSHRDAARDD